MITFTTATGSRYELDEAGRRIRRLAGNAPPTVRQGQDGEWRQYKEINTPVPGAPVLIVWRYRGDVAESTITSTVITVTEGEHDGHEDDTVSL